MPKILVEPTWCFVDPTPDEEEALDQGMAIDVPGAHFSNAYKRKYWDGKRHFYDKKAGAFPTGLLPFAVKLLKEARKNGGAIRPITFLDKRQPLTMLLKPTFAPGVHPLRDYQAHVVKLLLSHQLGILPFKQGIIQSPTGSGKTRMGLEIAARVPGRVLVITHRLGILDQWLDLFGNAGFSPIPPSLLGPPRHDDDEDEDEDEEDDDERPEGGWCTRFDEGKVKIHPTSRFGFGMIQTMSAMFKRKHPDFLKWLAGVRTLIVDEGHRVNDKQYFPVLQAIPAIVRVAFTATPLRRHDVGDVNLLGAFGSVIAKVGAKALFERNLLAKPTIYWKEVWGDDDEDEDELDDRSYAKAYADSIVSHSHRNRLIATRAVKGTRDGKSTLILVRSVKHGRILRRAILRIDPKLKVPYISGSMQMPLRKRLMKSFQARKFRILIGSGVLGEGIDLPAIDQLIIAAGGKGEIDAIQRVGRAMRPKQDGSGVPIFDYYDRTNVYLQAHAEARAAAHASMEYTQKGEVPPYDG